MSSRTISGTLSKACYIHVQDLAPISWTYFYLLIFFSTSCEVIGTEYFSFSPSPPAKKKCKKFSPKCRWKEDKTTTPHITLQLFDLDWVESWQSGSVKQFYLLTSCKLLMTLEILEVCFNSEVNNSINVIHCKLARKQVCTDEWQTPVTLQMVSFFWYSIEDKSSYCDEHHLFQRSCSCSIHSKASVKRKKIELRCKRIYKTD